MLTLLILTTLATTVPPGKWAVKESVSPMDDSRTVVLSLPAEADIEGWLAGKTRPVMVVRCLEGKMSALIATGIAAQVETPTYQATVTFRYDKEEAVTVAASKSSDGKAIFLPNPEHHIGLHARARARDLQVHAVQLGAADHGFRRARVARRCRSTPRGVRLGGVAVSSAACTPSPRTG